MTDLITTFDIPRLIKKREKLLADMRFQVSCLDELMRTNSELIDWEEGRKIKEICDPYFFTKFEKKSNKMGWAYALNKSGFRGFMDMTMRDEWDAKIKSGDLPPLTVENVHKTLLEIYESRHANFERAVERTFMRMSWDRENSRPILLDKKVIFSLCIIKGRHNMYRPTLQVVDELVNCFNALDGNAPVSHLENFASWVHGAPNDKPQTGLWTNYITVKLFDNNNAHITFKRPDLVEKLNGIIRNKYPE